MSAALMKLDLKRPHQTYKLADGTKVPGVTTVLGVLAKPALLKWYADEERAGIVRHLESWDGDACEMSEILAALPPKPFAETKRDKAADLGTVTHARCEAFLRGMELDPDGIPEELFAASLHGFERFRAWWDRECLRVIGSEVQMVSEVMRVGGTADIIAENARGELVLLDLKTSKPSRYYPYPETYAQVAAYAAMYPETGQGAVDRCFIVRIGKSEGDEGEVYEVTGRHRSHGLHLFDAARHAYDALKELGR